MKRLWWRPGRFSVSLSCRLFYPLLLPFWRQAVWSPSIPSKWQWRTRPSRVDSTIGRCLNYTGDPRTCFSGVEANSNATQHRPDSTAAVHVQRPPGCEADRLQPDQNLRTRAGWQDSEHISRRKDEGHPQGSRGLDRPTAPQIGRADPPPVSMAEKSHWNIAGPKILTDSFFSAACPYNPWS